MLITDDVISVSVSLISDVSIAMAWIECNQGKRVRSLQIFSDFTTLFRLRVRENQVLYLKRIDNQKQLEIQKRIHSNCAINQQQSCIVFMKIGFDEIFQYALRSRKWACDRTTSWANHRKAIFVGNFGKTQKTLSPAPLLSKVAILFAQAAYMGCNCDPISVPAASLSTGFEKK